MRKGLFLHHYSCAILIQQDLESALSETWFIASRSAEGLASSDNNEPC